MALWGDLLRGRLMVFTNAGGGFFGDLMESKLAAATQKDVTNPDVMKTRYIPDPRLEVNSRITNDRHPKCVVPRRANVTRRILYRDARYRGVPVLLSSRDAKGAFKLIPVSAKGLAYMGSRLAKFVYMYISLFFGWMPSPANWGIISTLLMQYIAAQFPNNSHIEGPESYLPHQYVDDGAFAEPWMGIRPWQALPLWEDALTRCLGPAAAHLEKRRIEGNSDTNLILWGIIVSTSGNTFALPREKIDRAKEFVMLPVFGPCITRIPLKRLQELRGRVEHWSNCNMSLGHEVRFIDRLLVSRSGITCHKGSSREIKQAYIDFWTCLETIRAHMATDTYWSQSYKTDFTGALPLDEQ